MEFYSATNEILTFATKYEILSFAHKWMEQKNIIINDVIQVQKAKVTCFLSYTEYRSNTNIAILGKTVHAKGRSHTIQGGKKKEVNKVNMVDVFSI
jgi:hypothetical protein